MSRYVGSVHFTLDSTLFASKPMEKNERAKYGTETVAAAKEQGGVGAGQSGDAEEIKEQRTD